MYINSQLNQLEQQYNLRYFFCKANRLESLSNQKILAHVFRKLKGDQDFYNLNSKKFYKKIVFSIREVQENSFSEIHLQKLVLMVARELIKYKEEVITKIFEFDFMKEQNQHQEWFALLKMAVKKHPKLIKNIRLLNIDLDSEKGVEELIELTLLAAKSLPVSNSCEPVVIIEDVLSLNINPDTPLGQKALIATAQILAHYPVNEIGFYISNFKIKDQKALIEIAKVAATFPDNELPYYIENFGINPDTDEGQQNLIEIAKIAAQHLAPHQEISYCIKNFKIKADQNQSALIHIAKLASKINGESVARYIENFGIHSHTDEGQQALIEIAINTLNADRPAFNLPLFIKSFKIKADENQLALIKIAKLAARKNSRSVAKHIKDFKINPNTEEGQQALIEIAEEIAQNQYTNISGSIAEFGIKPEKHQQALIKIAKLTAHNYSGLVHTIKSFGIDATTEEGQQALIEIATTLAKNKSSDLKHHIQKFEINAHTSKGQQALIHIAKIIARHFPIHDCIQNFEIQTDANGKKALFEIADISLKHLRVGEYLDFIQTFSKLLTEQDTQKLQHSFFSKNILYVYKALETSKALEIINLETCKKFIAWHYLQPTFFSDSHSEHDILEHSKNYTAASAYTNLFYTWLQAYHKKDENAVEVAFDEFAFSQIPALTSLCEKFSSLIIKIKKKTNSQHKIYGLTWLAFALVSLNIHAVPEENIKQMQTIKILEEISDVAAPQLRYQLLETLLKLTKDKKAWKRFLIISQTPDPKGKKKTRNKALLSNLYLSHLFQLEEIKASSPKEANKILLQQTQEITQLILANTVSFKNGQIHIQFLQLLENFSKNSVLTSDDKKYLLKEILSSKQLCSLIRFIQTIMDLGWESSIQKKKIKKRENVQGKLSFMKIANHIFAKKFNQCFSLKIDPDIALTLYRQTFAAFREPNALFTYLKKINQLTNEQEKAAVKADLMNFVETVLRGQFNSWRYEKTPFSHLEAVFANNEQLESLWRKENVSSVNELLATSDDQKGDCHINMQKLLTDSCIQCHFPTKTLPSLESYLKKTTQKPLPILKLELQEQIQEERKRNSDLLKKLEFELAAIQLIQTNERKTILGLLQQMIKSIDSGKIPELLETQFHQDLKGWMTQLNSLSLTIPLNPLQVYDTDHPWDLFRCGTEVLDSCQNIHGMADLNKCLLGYVIDGKHRLIAIKNHAGTIKARAILRILLTKETNSPALFIERIYPSLTKKEEQLAIVALAIQKAKQMNIPLFSCNEYEVGTACKSIHLESKSGKAHFEYVDANYLRIQKGSYTVIPNTILYDPFS